MKNILIALVFTILCTGLKAADYTIEITLSSETSGRLKYTSPTVSFETDCWFAKHTPLKRGTTYQQCAATKMAGKKNPKMKGALAIWVPEAGRQIFIHRGTNPSHSDGCVVIAPDKIRKLWNSIPQKDREIQGKVEVIVN